MRYFGLPECGASENVQVSGIPRGFPKGEPAGEDHAMPGREGQWDAYSLGVLGSMPSTDCMLGGPVRLQPGPVCWEPGSWADGVGGCPKASALMPLSKSR